MLDEVGLQPAQGQVVPELPPETDVVVVELVVAVEGLHCLHLENATPKHSQHHVDDESAQPQTEFEAELEGQGLLLPSTLQKQFSPGPSSPAEQPDILFSSEHDQASPLSPQTPTKTTAKASTKTNPRTKRTLLSLAILRDFTTELV
ncbi:MAG: hypothetical protein V1820_06645 [archaeon]